MVLNGNGRPAPRTRPPTACRRAATCSATSATRPSITPRTLVMFRPGYEAEGRRLARDLRVRIVRPLDGMRPRQLLGAHLVLILGT